MHSFSSVQKLLKAFQKIKLEVPDMMSRSASIKGNKFTVFKKLTEDNKPKVTTRGVIKCYGCNKTGLYAKDCPIKKEEQVKSGIKEITLKNKQNDCQMGLISKDKQQESTKSESESDEKPEEETEIYLVDVLSEPRDEFRRAADLQIEGNDIINCNAKIDTGCPITLIREQFNKVF
ncbi:phytoalexin-deficient 4-2 protein [Lasius niger]|uniref:Phytoalexin-deficient 4-2 protein n=1 Tax=Lasius niger TaxID=67767 RepID=A0A0J7MNW7_LASNI|nr:phytoalexin-deficient 4-2 protein [Lasius niger]